MYMLFIEQRMLNWIIQIREESLTLKDYSNSTLFGSLLRAKSQSKQYLKIAKFQRIMCARVGLTVSCGENCDMLCIVGSNLTIFKLEPTTLDMLQQSGQTAATSCAQPAKQCWDTLR